MRPIALLAILALTGCWSAPPDQSAASAVACADVAVPPLLGRVSDQGGLLDTGEEQRLAQRLADFTDRSGHQTVIVTVPSLNDEPLPMVARCIGNRWGVGDAARDDGLLILLAARERQVRIALGEGWGTRADDPRAAAAIAAMTPHFADGNFAAGLDSGIGVLERQFP